MKKFIFALLLLTQSQAAFSAVNRFSSSGDDSKITIDIYDSKSDPFLLYLSIQSPSYYSFLNSMEVEQFLISSSGDVTITLNKDKVKRITRDDKPVITKIQLKGAGAGALVTPEIVLTYEDGQTEKLEAKAKNIFNMDYKPEVGSVFKIFENANLPVEFKKFAEAKNLPPFTAIFNPAGSPSSSYSGYSYTPPVSVSKKEDLKLPADAESMREKIWNMLQMENKPTLEEFLVLLGNYKGPNPFKDYSSRSRKTDLENVAKIITKFEKAYPGATWYGLGRDVYLLNDAMDAFYTYIGQPGRVKRLHASQQSFLSSVSDDKYVYEFMKTNGIDLDKIDQLPPQIIFDTTSYGNSSYRLSQSRHLMRAIYNKWEKMGRQAKDLFRKVNFLAVNFNSSHVTLDEKTDMNAFFSKLTVDSGPKPLLTVLDDKLAYCQEWHGIYEAFQETADGRIETPFKRAHVGNAQRMAMLDELWQIRETIMNPVFVKSVEKLAKEYKTKPLLKSIKAGANLCRKVYGP